MITNPPEVTPTPNKVSPKTSRSKQWLQKTFPYFAQLPWQVWAMILILLSGGLSLTAFSSLLMLPKATNCPRIFWPIASASMRLYCAQLDADRGNVEGLLRAVELVEALPLDHPLRPEINRNVEDWAEEILNLAEKDVQAGRLAQAIQVARKIPTHSKAHEKVELKIERWQAIWQKGNESLAEIDNQLRKSNWDYAFRTAIGILNINNQYWSTVEYAKAIKKIQLAHEQSNQLNAAFATEKEGGLKNWLASLDQAAEIPKDSYSYQDAADLIQKNKAQIISYVYDLIEGQNWKKLQTVVEQVGARPLLKQNVAKWQVFLNAVSNTESDTPEGFQNAAITLGQISEKDPLYNKAESLIERWNLESKDLVYINKASELAKLGSINDYHAAIAQVEQIAPNNPRASQAGHLRDKWQAAIEVIEDQPIIDRAEAIVQERQDIISFHEAITQARAIGSDRALYKQAQNKIYKWQVEIEKIEDQPFLNQANSLADAKDYSRAIDTASRINSGRPLYEETQGKIRRWRREIRARNDLDSAMNIGASKTTETLIRAIEIVKDIPSSTEAIGEARNALNIWSGQLLNIARDRADVGAYREAIRIARLIPSESNVYSAAQTEIENWQKSLQPIPDPSNDSSSSP